MKKIIKIFGLYHTGTNFLSFLLKLNFNHHVCKEFLGWKHCFINDLNYIQNVSKLSGDNVCVIFCVRDPYNWIWRFIQNHYEFEFTSLKNPVYCKTYHSQEYYGNIVDMYNQKLKNYKEYIEKNSAMFINYENLINKQAIVLETIEDHYSLSRSNDNFQPFYKKINSEENIEGDIFDLKYINYHDYFSVQDINFINNNLDKEILEYFGYSIR